MFITSIPNKQRTKFRPPKVSVVRKPLPKVGPEVPETADFGVRISGDSMMPRYLDKQIVWIQKTDELNDGEIGIFYYNGNAYCKKLLCNKKGTYLISLNDKYEPIEIAEGETFKTFGRVVS